MKTKKREIEERKILNIDSDYKNFNINGRQ